MPGGYPGAVLGSRLRVGWRPSAYDSKVFSARIRAMLPAHYLARTGVQSTIVPPNGEGRYDCVVFQKAYGKRELGLAEAWKAQGVRLIFDLCDNHFYNPTDDAAIEQRIGRLRRMVDLVDAVTVSSPEIAKLIAPTPTFQVDDTLELLPFTAMAERLGWPLRRARRRFGRPVRLIWHGRSGQEDWGSGLTPVKNLVPELERLHAKLPLTLTIMSNAPRTFKRSVGGAGFPTRFVPWRPKTFAPVIARHDICLLPIERNQFTVCKTNNRARAALVLGVPVIADEIPSYREFGDWMFFGDWANHIAEYVHSPELASLHVRTAQAHIAQTYTEELVVRQWNTVLEAVFSQKSR